MTRAAQKRTEKASQPQPEPEPQPEPQPEPEPEAPSDELAPQVGMRPQHISSHQE